MNDNNGLKILLINPPPRKRSFETIVVPPLGLLYLAAILKKNNIPVNILDAYALNLSWNDFEKKLKEFQPDIIGIGGMTPVIDVYIKAIKISRKYCKFLIMGGPHLSAYKQYIFKNIPEIDYGIVGEAENSFLQLINCIINGNYNEIPKIPGILTKDYYKGDIAKIDNLDEVPFPARDLIPLKRYRYSLAKYEPIFTMMTSRGCPYQCIFCDKTVFGSKWRARSPQNVVDEIEEIIKKYNGKYIIFYDDLFTVSKERTISICKLIIERDLKIEWKCEGRVDRIDEETLEWMKKAGCSLIAYGIESGNQKSLNYLKKNFKVEQIEKAFKLTKKFGIKTLAYFILGIPNENYSEALKSIDFACKLNPDFIQFSLLSPTYGTKLYSEAIAKGWYREIDAKDPLGKDIKRAVLISPEWTEEKLKNIIKIAYRKFYYRPSYILNKLRQINSFGYLINTLKQSVKLSIWLLKAILQKQ